MTFGTPSHSIIFGLAALVIGLLLTSYAQPPSSGVLAFVMIQWPSKLLVWITGANGPVGNYLIQTAPRFAPRWRANSFWQRADSGLRF
jgi:hypothetical protein